MAGGHVGGSEGDGKYGGSGGGGGGGHRGVGGEGEGGGGEGAANERDSMPNTSSDAIATPVSAARSQVCSGLSMATMALRPRGLGATIDAEMLKDEMPMPTWSTEMATPLTTEARPASKIGWAAVKEVEWPIMVKRTDTTDL